MSLHRTKAVLFLATMAMWFAPAAQAYSELVVFGDSLSDNGNLWRAAFRFLPAPPYFEGRFTNGPVAVEVMAQSLDIPLVNLSFGGASAGADNLYVPGSFTGLAGQISAYLSMQPSGQAIDSGDLYVVWGGGNDLLSALTGGQAANMQPVIDLSVQNLTNNVLNLYEAGARDVMVPLLPDMATSFYGTSGQYDVGLLAGISESFNAQLSLAMGAVQAASPDLTLRVFDLPSVLTGVRAELAAAGGNVTDRCWSGEFTGRGSLCANPDAYYLFDRVHPTAVVHRAVGLAMAAAVPEPEGLVLVTMGLLALAFASQLRRKRR